MVINSLGQATAGRGADMNASAGDVQQLAVDLQVIAHTLAQNSDHFDALIADLSKVMQTIAAWHAQFRGLIASWDQVMRTLAAREAALQGTVTEQDRVMTILDQALAGSAPQSLHDALAMAPSTLSHANQYLGSANVGFGVVRQDTPGIAQLFDQLASVMSGVGIADETGAPDKGRLVHMWRDYCVQAGAQQGSKQ
jgi:ABC-type transporter Mla subunit MlaD